MSISIKELLTSLDESGLLSAEEMSLAADKIARMPSVRTADELARELVRQSLLTKLQAAAVLAGKIKNIIFGDYVVLEKIGSGGMGQVFRSKHRPTGKLVALKVLSAEAVKNRRLVERFKKEARAVARLKHPNIVRAYEAGKINRIRYLVMEFVDGENLLDRVKRKQQLSIDETISCVLQAAQGLEYAHQKGVIHRDIKPSNFMRDRKGRVKILDMGLAHVEDSEEEEEDRLTMPGQMLGTARFMAPEQIEDARKSDVRSDIYSLGCTMYFLLRGKAPYSGETMAHTLMAHVSSPIPDLCKKRTDVPQWLGDVFKKMLAKRPSERYQSMAELIEDIQSKLGADLDKHDHVLFGDEPQENDEFSKLMQQRSDEGTSLEQLYLDDEKSDARGDEFSATADPDIPDVPMDPRAPMSGVLEKRSTAGSVSELASAVEPPAMTPPPRPVAPVPVATPVAPPVAVPVARPVEEPQSEPHSPRSLVDLEVEQFNERINWRRQQDRASEKRMQLLFLVVGGAILLGVIWFLFLRK